MAVLERDKKISAVALSALVAWFALTCSCVGSKTSRIMPPDVAGKLYIAEYGRVDDINVRIVSGQYVRENLDEEFTNFGQHYRFRFIPVNEFWLDQQNAPGEESFFVRHLLIEHKLMAQGMNYEKALERADAAELAERSKTKPALEGEALLKSGRTAELMGRIHKQFLEEYGTDVKVWVVDGELVRNLCFIDFTEGGHDKVYRFVPEKEVWLDDDLMPEERRLVLLHEMHERYLMAHGWPYSKAHKDSSKLESRCRRHPGQLDASLKAEIGKTNVDAASAAGSVFHFDFGQLKRLLVATRVYSCPRSSAENNDAGQQNELAYIGVINLE